MKKHSRQDTECGLRVCMCCVYLLVYVSVTGRTPAESKDAVNEALLTMYCSGCHWTCPLRIHIKHKHTHKCQDTGTGVKPGRLMKHYSEHMWTCHTHTPKTTHYSGSVCSIKRSLLSFESVQTTTGSTFKASLEKKEGIRASGHLTHNYRADQAALFPPCHWKEWIKSKKKHIF